MDILGGIAINQFKQVINSQTIKSTLNKSSKTNKIYIPLIVLAILMGYMYFDVDFTKVQYVDIKADKIQGDDSVKILQISDFHDNKSKRVRNRILSSIKELEPDIIVLTGDFIDSTTKDFEGVNGFIEKIVNINPNVYFVSGNHEWSSGYNIRFTQELKSRGVTILNNGNSIININSTLINLCGIDDYYTSSYNMDSAFNKIDGRNYTILLSHAPDIIFKQKDIPADLILSGHTHGGQIRLPLIGALVAPGQGLFPKYNKGLYSINNRTKIYIDSGVGTTAMPIRFCNRSQISLITIKR